MYVLSVSINALCALLLFKESWNQEYESSQYTVGARVALKG